MQDSKARAANFLKTLMLFIQYLPGQRASNDDNSYSHRVNSLDAPLRELIVSVFCVLAGEGLLDKERTASTLYHNLFEGVDTVVILYRSILTHMLGFFIVSVHG